MTNEHNTIRDLLDRFMAGETSLQEERQLAQWFSDHPQVDADLEDYRLMFAYFNEGMPRQATTHQRKLRVCAAIAAAASLALAIAMMWPGGHPADTPMAQATPTPCIDTLTTPEPPATETDTLPMKEETKKNADRYRRHRFSPAPPKVLLAEASASQEPTRISIPTEEPECEDVQWAAWSMTDAERRAISAIGDQQAEEAVRQLERLQRLYIENAIDTLNWQLQMAGLDDNDKDEENVY